jgi:hypothetical protein
MTPYRFRRRAFLAGLGGAVGLRILLENLEASAQGATSPPRFLRIHWPLGTVPYQFIPNGTGSSYVTSPILEPFETAGLRSEMIALHGLRLLGITDSYGGPHEGGTVLIATGANSPGTRQNNGEPDDTVAGGPSWDQIFLKQVPALARRDASGAIVGHGFVSVTCETRVDSYEIATRTLSYDYTKNTIMSARPGGTISENAPISPALEPLALYNKLFSGFMPGGTDQAALKALRMRKSVLDSALRELARIHDYSPAAERPKIDAHAEAIRRVEQELSAQIGMSTPGTCMLPPLPPVFPPGRTVSNVYGDPTAPEDESAIHAQVGAAHLNIIRAAFQCDLIRVATFQWAPGQSHVAFAGMTSDQQVYRHHPLSHRVTDSSVFNGPPPTGANLLVYEFLTNVHKWYNQMTANVLTGWKGAVDAFGGNLLDHTVIPCMTEVGDAAHQRSDMPALVFGGRALGMQGGQFQRLSAVPYNSLWATVAQALFQSSDPLSLPELADEVFVRTDVAPIPGLWVRPT